MSIKKPLVKVAVVQAASVLFNKEECLQKTVEYIRRAGREGAELVLFPEAFIPGYPRGFDFGTVVGSRSEAGRKLWGHYWRNSFSHEGPELEVISRAVKENNLFLGLGVVEQDALTRGSLYCSLLYFGANGRLLGKHRKLKPTAGERYIWGEGSADSLTVIDSEIGRIGGLICWENYMPLARMSMYRFGVEIYLAPTADCRDTWQSTLRHIACEGRCFVLGCNQYVTQEMISPELLKQGEIRDLSLISCRGGSVILSPRGEVLAGPLYGEEGILFADLDINQIRESRFDFDAAGHYNRPDVFTFNVPDQPPPVKSGD
jgi:nitrilase